MAGAHIFSNVAWMLSWPVGLLVGRDNNNFKTASTETCSKLKIKRLDIFKSRINFKFLTYVRGSHDTLGILFARLFPILIKQLLKALAKFSGPLIGW